MNSPVDINFQSFLKIDRKKNETDYMQIVYQFINAVNSKIYPAVEKFLSH